MTGLYQRAGANLGNLLFTNAVWRQLAWTNADQAFLFDPDYANAHFDCVVIPAANWLYSGFDMTALADRVEKLRVPTVMIGIGAQAEQGSSMPKVSPSALRLVKAVSERSALIGARGEFSAEVLSHYGIKNVQVTGCPSLYLSTHEQPAVVKSERPKHIILAGTRYYLEPKEAGRWDVLQQGIFRLGFEEKIDLLYQSERPELDYLIAADEAAFDATTTKRALAYYGAESAEELLGFLREHGRCHLDVSQWMSSMRGYDLYLGSRIHGAITALLVGTPAIVVAHDTRTSELSAFASIPTVPLSEVEGLSLERIERLYEATSWDAYMARMKKARLDYIRFLDTNGLKHWIKP
jgi:polysaccharide pyruvyl transferase WcaK-like protein